MPENGSDRISGYNGPFNEDIRCMIYKELCKHEEKKLKLLVD